MIETANVKVDQAHPLIVKMSVEQKNHVACTIT